MSRPAREPDPAADAGKPLGPEIRPVDESPAEDDVLVYNARMGVYQGHLSSVNVQLSTERQQRIDMRTLVLMPGLNYAPRDLFGKLSDQPGLAHRIAGGEIIEVHSFAAISAPQAIEWIKHTASLPTLQRLREVPKMQDRVREALEAQIRMATNEEEPTRVLGRRASA